MLQDRYAADDAIEAGVDEAGRGCLWGPMVAAAVVWPPQSEWDEELRTISGQLRDSKKVSEKRRTILRNAIEAHAISFAVGVVEPGEIDDLGMTAANKLAFQRAVEGLDVPPDRLLVDGILLPDFFDGEAVVEAEADNRYIPVAAASILAKTWRDGWVAAYCEEHPECHTRYGLAKNKGYGTAQHQKGIEAHGIHEQHRRLFLRRMFSMISDE